MWRYPFHRWWVLDLYQIFNIDGVAVFGNESTVRSSMNGLQTKRLLRDNQERHHRFANPWTKQELSTCHRVKCTGWLVCKNQPRTVMSTSDGYTLLSTTAQQGVLVFDAIPNRSSIASAQHVLKKHLDDVVVDNVVSSVRIRRSFLLKMNETVFCRSSTIPVLSIESCSSSEADRTCTWFHCPPRHLSVDLPEPEGQQRRWLHQLAVDEVRT